MMNKNINKEGHIVINLELYRIFKIVADKENLTKASEILHISQPAVTKHIKNLENELNVQEQYMDKCINCLQELSMEILIIQEEI